MVEFADSSSTIARRNPVRPRRPRLGLGLVIRGEDGSVCFAYPADPDRENGPVEAYLDAVLHGQLRESGDEPAVRQFGVQHGNGEAILQVHRVPFGADHGQVLEMVQDVTVSVRCMEQAVERRVIDRVARRLGHEINNPLAAIFGAIEVLLLDGPPPEFRRPLEVVMDQADRISGVVHGLRQSAAEDGETGTEQGSELAWSPPVQPARLV